VRLRLGAVAVAGILAALPGARAASAHEQERKPRMREIVRAQGYLGEPPPGSSALRTVELAVLGETRRLHATEWRRYAAEEEKEPAETEAPARITVQGSRADLQRLKKATPAQRVTLLGERRAGSTDLFLLAVDLCPPD
jgi:hypothetical protein